MAGYERMAPVRREDYPELEDVFQSFQGKTGFVTNALMIMARRPALLRARHALSDARTEEATLDPQLSDLVSLIATLQTGCRYSQAHRAQSFTKRDIEDEKFRAIEEFETNPIFSDKERAALRLARDSATVPNAVTDEHFVELRKYFDEGEIVDIIARSCLSAWMNRWNDTMATQLEDDSLHDIARMDPNWQPGMHRR